MEIEGKRTMNVRPWGEVAMSKERRQEGRQHSVGAGIQKGAEGLD